MLPERFVDKLDIGDCWEWTAALTEGYGVYCVSTAATAVRAHRYAYEQLVGPIPDGMTLDHLCRNRRCVNPDHVEPVTNGQNVLRGHGPSAKSARREHCARGHRYDRANTYLRVDGRGRRQCRACHRDAQARYAERRRARLAEHDAKAGA